MITESRASDQSCSGVLHTLQLVLQDISERVFALFMLFCRIDVVVIVICSGHLYRGFRETVKVVQVCSEMIQTTEFPRPDSTALLSRQKVKLNDGQRMQQVTVHHQIRECDVPQVSTALVPTDCWLLVWITCRQGGSDI